ncbi:universal stress protein [Streptomyces bobili]|uniref:universal stress protein n=1 Tax=Streptomyces bobili TaxID=67280 RepID=UPI00225C1E5C|nr:universal stress protein [Streptomyces bobili]MCX5521664.1 universal stress protein [Streptomyces bobili]
MTDIVTAGTIVVGVDGSEASASALRWATEQARALRAEVVAVHAWEPSGPRFAPYAPVSARPSADAERDAAARRPADTLREVLGKRADVTVRAELVEGPAVPVLLASEGTVAGDVPNVPTLRDRPTVGPKGPHWGLAARGPRGPTGTVWSQRRCHGESSPGPRTSHGTVGLTAARQERAPIAPHVGRPRPK